MLRVGIDATAIPANRAGAGNYIFNLVDGLARIDTSNQYCVFAKPRDIQEWDIHQDNVQFIPCASDDRLIRLVWEQSVLPALLRKYNISVLHSPHYTVPLLKVTRSVVTVCDMTCFLHPDLHSLSKRMFFRQIIRVSVRRADRIITISESTANDLFAIFSYVKDAGKVRAIPLAASRDFCPTVTPGKVDSVCRLRNLAPGEFILCVGVLEPRKNIPVLLQAYRYLVDRGVRNRLVFVGKPGWMYADVFATANRLGVTNYVSFVGHVPAEELPALYTGAAVFVYPSLYEGFGLPVLEAMACRCPVITSNVSSMPEIVGEAGLLINPHDPYQLAAAMERVLGDDCLRQSLREKGVKRAAEFSWERTARETVKVYLEACQ